MLIAKDKIKTSIDLIINSSIPYEFRATIFKEAHQREVLEKMAQLISGAKKFYLQTFRPTHVLNEKFEGYHAYSREEMEKIAEMFGEFVTEVEIRN